MFLWSERWPNFAPEEVLSPDGLGLYRSDHIIMIDPPTMDFMQEFRNFLECPIIINVLNTKPALLLRGYRSPKENIVARGATYSAHTQGKAFDCHPAAPMTLDEFYKKAVEFGWARIKRYKTWLHLDNVITEEEQTIILPPDSGA